MSIWAVSSPPESRSVHSFLSGCQRHFTSFQLTQFVQRHMASHRLAVGEMEGVGGGGVVVRQYLCLWKSSLQKETVSKQNRNVNLHTLEHRQI